ncbi:MAG: tetratricopeptide repeat protein [Chitinophagaceae bacterium]
MKLRVKIFFVFILFGVGILLPSFSYAQTSGIDTAAAAKRLKNEFKKQDSIYNSFEKKRIQDSIAKINYEIRKQFLIDSLAEAKIKKRIADSTARELARLKIIRDKEIRDSTAQAEKQKREDALARAKFISDSTIASKKAIMDSILDARRAYNDSMKTVRLNQKIEREALRKYKASKKYKDSIELARQQVKDSIKNARDINLAKIKAERERINDSIKLVRTQYNDSIKNVRTKTNDSLRLVRTKTADSLKQARQTFKDSMLAIRKVKRDSLNAKKGITGEKEKTKEKQELALAIKMHEKKQEEWTNDKLLKRKWSLPRKIYQNTVSRYNYFYNARRKYNNATENLTKNNKDDFEKLIQIEPYDIEKNGSSVAGEMDSVIKKCSFSTQLHDPRSKWNDNLYLLMGKASFIKNDYSSAINTFQFIANEYKDDINYKNKKYVKNKKKTEGLSIATIENRKGLRKLSHHPIRNSALLWLSKSYIMAEQYSEAMALLNTLEDDKNFPKRYYPFMYQTLAQVHLKQNNTNDAIAALEKSMKGKLSKSDKIRTSFLLGQLFAQEKNYAKSTEYYKKAISGKSSPDMDFYTRLNIAENAANSGTDLAFAKKQLHDIIKENKFEKYRGQAYATLAKIESQSNAAKAIEYYTKSITNASEPILKAKSFASLAELQYNLGHYQEAKIAYDSAYQYGTNPPLDNIADITTRKNVLGEVVTYLNTIHTQDSLLDLASKSDKEQKEIAKKTLSKIQKAIKEETENNTTQVVALTPDNKKNNSNWYFYNNELIQKGSKTFNQKWGVRKLEDNWRRKAALGLLAFSNEGEDGADGKEDQILNTDVGFLLSKIPKTPAQIDESNQKINDAYYNLGLTYFSQLNDYPNSVKTFDTLILRYPSTSYKKQSYYALLLNHTQLNNVAQIEKYKKLLDAEFQNSTFDLLANHPEQAQASENKQIEVQNHYEQTYNLYLQQSYDSSLDFVSYAKTKYTEDKLMPKYRLVEALCMAGKKNIDSCAKILLNITATYPNTEEHKRALDILKYIQSAQGNEMDDTTLATQIEIAQGTNNKSLDDQLTDKAYEELKNYEGKGSYIHEPNIEHFILIFMKTIDGKALGVKSAISDYNLLKHNVEGYTTGMNMLTSKQGIITIHIFDNSIFAKKYLDNLSKEKLIFSQLKKNDYEFAIITQANYMELLKTRDILGYLKFYKKNYK